VLTGQCWCESLILLFSEKVEDSPPPFIFENGKWLSYRELTSQVRLIAALLPRRKALAFCFCGINSATVFNYLACLEAGHAVALLDAGLNATAKSDLIARYKPELLLSSRELETDFGDYGRLPHQCGSSRVWVRNSFGDEPHKDLALLLPTSGSTGSPKFVRLSLRNIISNADSIRAALAITANDRAMASLPFNYSYGLSVLNSHLRSGAALALTTEGLMASGFWDVCRQAECTSMAGVPYSYQVIKRLGLEMLNVSSINTMTQAGGKLAPELISEFHTLMQRRGGRFFVMYGQTEATARMAILPFDALPAKLGSAGLPIPGGSFTIETAPGEIATDPEIKGELVYRGANVMMGYATGRADLALGDGLNGELHTGDLCQLDADGFLYVCGRMNRDAKVAGFRINLDEVEAILKNNGPTAAIAGSNKILIYCEYGDVAYHASLRSYLASRLNLNIHAFEFRRVGSLPLKTNGKIDYASLAVQP
jgi:acyl-CoA synthetase (AMP-forming)/AMP-acid ligase II